MEGRRTKGGVENTSRKEDFSVCSQWSAIFDNFWIKEEVERLKLLQILWRFGSRFVWPADTFEGCASRFLSMSCCFGPLRSLGHHSFRFGPPPNNFFFHLHRHV